MRYVISGLTEVINEAETVYIPAVVVHYGIQNFVSPSCECIADVISQDITLPEGNYVLVGMFDTDALVAINAGYIEAFPTNPTNPAYLAGE